MPGKILLIDDEPELVAAVEIRLKANGYNVDFAYDGQAGMDKIKESKPDLILLDIVMPKLDGYEVCKKLKADPEAKDIPVIIFSASQRKGFEEKYRALGVENFIFKPFESRELLEMIKKVIAKG